ncbi:hypothetical protein F383_14408 [Gossypium arboreum]|uniref:Uncharacterized protein n=1 Tax=Gossypium arboreum TaxID=29729 RepID=A0A0B0N946_GOSAR|nr:hypothetical protein F383_14408 [Gossypium arboreum]
MNYLQCIALEDNLFLAW